MIIFNFWNKYLKMSILVMKFGGTSVGNLNRIKKLTEIVKKIDKGQKENNFSGFSNEWCYQQVSE